MLEDFFDCNGGIPFFNHSWLAKLNWQMGSFRIMTVFYSIDSCSLYTNVFVCSRSSGSLFVLSFLKRNQFVRKFLLYVYSYLLCCSFLCVKGGSISNYVSSHTLSQQVTIEMRPWPPTNSRKVAWYYGRLLELLQHCEKWEQPAINQVMQEYMNFEGLLLPCYSSRVIYWRPPCHHW